MDDRLFEAVFFETLVSPLRRGLADSNYMVDAEGVSLVSCKWMKNMASGRLHASGRNPSLYMVSIELEMCLFMFMIETNRCLVVTANVVPFCHAMACIDLEMCLFMFMVETHRCNMVAADVVSCCRHASGRDSVGLQ